MQQQADAETSSAWQDFGGVGTYVPTQKHFSPFFHPLLVLELQTQFITNNKKLLTNETISIIKSKTPHRGVSTV